MQQAIRIDAAAIGRRLKCVRQARGLSQRELATDGVSYAYVSRLEAGLRIASLQALIALARRLDTTAERLVFGSPLPDRCIFCGRARSHGRHDAGELDPLE